MTPSIIGSESTTSSRRRAWSAEDRQRQRQNCLRQQPWRHSIGPRTPEGKTLSRLNGHHRRPDPQSMRQCRQQVDRDINGLIARLAELRNSFEPR